MRLVETVVTLLPGLRSTKKGDDPVVLSEPARLALTMLKRTLTLAELLPIRANARNANKGDLSKDQGVYVCQVDRVSEQPSIILEMVRGTDAQQLRWMITFTVYELNLDPKQFTLFEEDLTRVISDREHIHDLAIAHSDGVVMISLVAEIGVLVAPM